MSREQINFLNMFPDYEPPEALKSAISQAAISAADIDPVLRTISVCLDLPVYINRRNLQQIGQDIAAIYGLQELALRAQYPADQLHNLDPQDVMDLFVEESSMCRGSLAGAQWRWEDDTLHIHLKANGKEELLKAVPIVVGKIKEQFSAGSFKNCPNLLCQYANA